MERGSKHAPLVRTPFLHTRPQSLAVHQLFDLATMTEEMLKASDCFYTSIGHTDRGEAVAAGGAPPP